MFAAVEQKLSIVLWFYFCYFAGCHTKVHKDHLDKNEEFVGYCKGECLDKLKNLYDIVKVRI